MARRNPPPPGSCTLERFARRIDENLWHVEQLRDAGRLVMTADGKHVDIDASIVRMRETAGQQAEPSDRAVSFAAFARILGERSPSYVTQLKDDGRLALAPDGKRVLVDASIALIKSTSDPAKAGVSARHAASRDAKAGNAATMPPVAPPVPAQRDGAGDDEPEAAEPPDGFQYWRKRNERAKALASERENAVADGKLLDAGEVTAAIAAAATTLRTRLEGLPDVLGPQLAGVNDEAQARALLAEAIEHALEEASRDFSILAKQVSA